MSDPSPHFQCRDSASPLRIVEIIEATTGGTRKHLYYLLKYLDREKFQVTLIYSCRRDEHFRSDLEQFRTWGITLREVPMRREISPWHDLWALLSISWILARGGFHLVHAHSSKAGFLGRIAARIAGIRTVIYSPHSFAFQYCARSLRGKLYLFLERLASRWQQGLICVSRGEYELALRHRLASPSQAAVIPNAVPHGEPAPRCLPEQIRAQAHIPEGVPVVGMVAQFRPQKGYRHFLAAIPLVLRRHPQTRFLIVGDGPQFDEAKRLVLSLGAESQVIFVGHQENPYDFYQIMDVFVLSSLWEGMPYVILEAMAMGLPVVATDIAGNNELISHNRNGFLVPPEDSAAIARHVSLLLEDGELRSAFAAENQKKLAEMANINQWIKAYEEIYQRLQTGCITSPALA